jgi:hypothetical protein
MPERVAAADDEKLALAGVHHLSAENLLGRLRRRARGLPRLDAPDDAPQVIETVQNALVRR